MYNERDYYRPTGFGGFSFFPPVIKNLLIINAIVYLVNNLLLANIIIDGVPGEYIITRYFALWPIGSDSFYLWQLITYQFMHGNFMHILFNMFLLWMFGLEIENLWGSKKFLIYYLTCGVGAGLMQILLAPAFTGLSGPTVGASGAIYGVLIAFAMIFPDRYIFLWFLIPVKAKYLIAFFIVLEFLSLGNMDLIARFAHLGGALVGFIYIMFDSRTNIKLKNIFGSFKSSSGGGTKTQFRRRPRTDSYVEDAEFYDIDSRKKSSGGVTQEEIDRILDKISQSGYQNLTEKEKKILFEASKKS